WLAFKDLQRDHFIYLPYFLDHFLERVPSAIDAVVGMAQVRSINLLLTVPPSVSNPFPTPITVPTSVNGVNGFVDSLTQGRSNTMTSSHFYTFTTTGGAVSIRMDITGFGPGNKSDRNDLDLFLMDANG